MYNSRIVSNRATGSRGGMGNSQTTPNATLINSMKGNPKIYQTKIFVIILIIRPRGCQRYPSNKKSRRL